VVVAARGHALRVILTGALRVAVFLVVSYLPKEATRVMLDLKSSVQEAVQAMKYVNHVAKSYPFYSVLILAGAGHHPCCWEVVPHMPSLNKLGTRGKSNKYNLHQITYFHYYFY
jgi:hypothetical protein